MVNPSRLSSYDINRKTSKSACFRGQSRHHATFTLASWTQVLSVFVFILPQLQIVSCRFGSDFAPSYLYDIEKNNYDVVKCCFDNRIPKYCLKMCDGKTQSFSSRDICRGAYEDIRKLCFIGPSSDENYYNGNENYKPSSNTKLYDPFEANDGGNEFRSDQNVNKVQLYFPQNEKSKNQKDLAGVIATNYNWLISFLMLFCLLDFWLF